MHLEEWCEKIPLCKIVTGVVRPALVPQKARKLFDLPWKEVGVRRTKWAAQTYHGRLLNVFPLLLAFAASR
jgi:hypothetical protein